MSYLAHFPAPTPQFRPPRKEKKISLKKFHIFFQNKTFLYFWMELSRPKPEKQKNPLEKYFLYFSKIEFFLYFGMNADQA